MRAPLRSLDVPAESSIRYTPRVLEKIFKDIILPRSITLVHGFERAPLTIIAHSIAVSVTKSQDDALCVFLDSGTNYSPNLVRSISSSPEILKRILVGGVMSLSDINEMTDEISKLQKVSIIILDSLTGALNLSGSPGSKTRQRELFSTLETLRNTVNELDTHMLITDHSSRDWSSRKVTPIGGNVLSHAMDNIVRVFRLRETENLIRIHTERSISKITPPGIIVRVDSRGIRSLK